MYNRLVVSHIACRDKSQITEVLYLLLKDKVLNACSIVLTRKNSGETLATYNLQVGGDTDNNPIA